MKRLVYLVPGFFGFDSLGAFAYFNGVAEALRGALEQRGISARVIECSTQPTAFVKHRARHLAEQLAQSGASTVDEIHLIGHSTGGLDVRQLLTPDVQLMESDLQRRIGERTRSAVLLATPHLGTPLASFFSNVRARHALRVLAEQLGSRRLAIFVGAKLVRLAARADDIVGGDQGTLDLLSAKLLRHLTLDPDDPFWRFMHDVAADQGSIIQLTPQWMEHFNQAVGDRPQVAYSSVLTAAPAPLAGGLRRLLARRPLGQAGAYVLLHELCTSPGPIGCPQAAQNMLRQRIPFQVDERTNDGIVPTLSQPYGELLDAVVADHLDIVGQFRRPGAAQSTDWLLSGSGFDLPAFVRLWEVVADEIARNAG